MSGPSLTKRDSHHAIHEAAFAEAEELTRLLRQSALAGDRSRALQLVGVLVEHWQTRTLRHAEAEEQGWYRELARERPELQADILQLTRDHDLLRMLLGEIEQIIAVRGWVAGIVERFEAMLLVNAIHSRTEEQRLLGNETPTPIDRATEVALTSEHSMGVPVGRALARDVSDDMSGHLPAGEALGANDGGAGESDMPLAVAYPRLYRLAVERLGERGIQPGDLRLSVHSSGVGCDELHSTDTHLIAAFGPGFSQTLELPLPAVSNQLAVEQALEAIADACERAVRSEYFEAMRITEPGAPGSGSRDGGSGKRARFSLTVLDPSKG